MTSRRSKVKSYRRLEACPLHKFQGFCSKLRTLDGCDVYTLQVDYEGEHWEEWYSPIKECYSQESYALGRAIKIWYEFPNAFITVQGHKMVNGGSDETV